MYINEAVRCALRDGKRIRRQGAGDSCASYMVNKKSGRFDKICPKGQENVVYKDWHPTQKELMADDWEVVKG